MSPRVSRREQLVEHATRLFVEQGYHATSVRQITQAADCNEAALYYHFPKGKRELLQAVIEEQTPDLVDALEHCQ
ncbi:MAG TPA: helix-turn-helix domain-containing protein, partial [Phototrophicaceae bacterium]|nr:helix-turn-helix domain-containing protein [Phototrophicaceae bacterium]